MWWVKLGIWPELNEPGHPEQNGRYERMHRTPEADVPGSPAANARGQQHKYTHFRAEYNHVQSHEPWTTKCPRRCMVRSWRAYPERVLDIACPAQFEVRRVSRDGGIKFGSRLPNICPVLAEETVGLEEIADGVWAVYIGPLRLGRFDERELQLYGA